MQALLVHKDINVSKAKKYGLMGPMDGILDSISTPCSTDYHGKYANLSLLSNISPPIL